MLTKLFPTEITEDREPGVRSQESEGKRASEYYLLAPGPL